MALIKIDGKSYSKLLKSVMKNGRVEEGKIDLRMQDRLDKHLVYY
jgi:hypothetical protein